MSVLCRFASDIWRCILCMTLLTLAQSLLHQASKLMSAHALQFAEQRARYLMSRQALRKHRTKASTKEISIKHCVACWWQAGYYLSYSYRQVGPHICHMLLSVCPKVTQTVLSYPEGASTFVKISLCLYVGRDHSTACGPLVAHISLCML